MTTTTRLLDTTSPIPVDDGVAGARAVSRLGDLEVGVWEITPGTSTDVEADEVFVVLSGRGTVAFAGSPAESIDLAPGVAVHLRAGDRTTWTIHETLRKLYLT